ncbi:NTP transferase domain-containing protein [Myceligenerans salitolerans]|uniref:Phosphoenolpyruvate guanylyltransferase n=1 Tax=Myceligenerans salitolerans TaxID=1230528 RepID=A0ABS3IEE7_9MICO|nr:NTP transferase domain-containing protein [Myceligenerans salitolerans]MBO0611011.1 2-phospho-L-lactate guanylyltransferase [Myceligenerans salitolerans]
MSSSATPAPAGPARLATGVTAVVPLRDGVSGKSRLASVLDDDGRRALITVLAQHVVGTLLATPQVHRVVVVTADIGFARSAVGELSDVGELAFLAQSPDRPGLNAALDTAREAVGSGTPDAGNALGAPSSLLVAHADLPALTPADITALATRAPLHPDGRRSGPPPERRSPELGAPDRPQAADVVIATDRAGRGTNLLLLNGGAAVGFRFRFGPDSRHAHEAEARRLGLRAVTTSRPSTAVDLDTVDDWNELPAEVRTAVARYARFPSR